MEKNYSLLWLQKSFSLRLFHVAERKLYKAKYYKASVLTLNRFGALPPGSQPKPFLSLLFSRGLPWIRPPACCQGSRCARTSISVSLSLSLLFLQGSRLVFESRSSRSVYSHSHDSPRYCFSIQHTLQCASVVVCTVPDYVLRTSVFEICT